MLQPLARVANAGAFADRAGEPSPLSRNVECPANRRDARQSPSRATFLARLDAVLDGILHERLQHEPRHQRVERRRIDVELECQASWKRARMIST
jgi:hypothetical protein